MHQVLNLANFLNNHDFSIDLIFEEKLWEEKSDQIKEITIKSCSTIFKQINILNLTKKTEMTVFLSNNQRIQALNKQFLKKDYPTNVLSFPSLELKNNNYPKNLLNKDYLYLGDIIVSLQIINQEAIDQCKTFNNHFTHMLIHGILHLLGFDHQNEADAIEMEQLEIDLLSKLDIPSPYNN